MADTQLILLRLRVVIPVLGKDERPTFLCAKQSITTYHFLASRVG